MEEARTDGLAGMRAPVQTPEEMRTAFDAQNAETNLGESGNEFGACDTGSPAHAAIRAETVPQVCWWRDHRGPGQRLMAL